MIRPATALFIAIAACLFAPVASASDAQHAPQPSQLRAGLELLDRAAHLKTDKPQIARRLASDAAGLIDASLEPEQRNSPLAQRALGNAHLIADELGYAVLAFRRALDADPSDQQAAASLAHARTQIDIRPPEQANRVWTSLIQRARSVLPRRAAFMIAAGAFLAACLAAALALQLAPRCAARRISLTISTAALVLALAPASVLAADRWVANRADAAAVVVNATEARTGPDADIYPPVFETPVAAGTEVIIQDERSGWLLVRIGAVEAWLPETNIRRVRPTKLPSTRA